MSDQQDGSEFALAFRPQQAIRLLKMLDAAKKMAKAAESMLRPHTQEEVEDLRAALDEWNDVRAS